LTNLTKWRWIPTKLNVADDATRDISLTDLSPRGRWFAGPEFLKLQESEWPQEKKLEAQISDEAKEEIKIEVNMVINFSEQLINLNRFSNYKRLVRTVGWLRRFLTNCQRMKRSGDLKVEEVQEAEKVLWKLSQAYGFPEEVELLKSGKSVGKSRRNIWPRGTIVATFPGNDDQVRVVDVKTALGTFRRPASKIAVLDVFRICEESESITVASNVVVNETEPF